MKFIRSRWLFHDILECFRTKNKNQAVSYLMKGLTTQIASPHTFSVSISENPIGLKKRQKNIAW